MSWYTRLVSGVLFPLHERLKQHTTVRVRRDMERTQWLTCLLYTSPSPRDRG